MGLLYSLALNVGVFCAHQGLGQPLGHWIIGVYFSVGVFAGWMATER